MCSILVSAGKKWQQKIQLKHDFEFAYCIHSFSQWESDFTGDGYTTASSPACAVTPKAHEPLQRVKEPLPKQECQAEEVEKSLEQAKVEDVHSPVLQLFCEVHLGLCLSQRDGPTFLFGCSCTLPFLQQHNYFCSSLVSYFI